MTLSVYVVGLSMGQLTYGPISDHFGRRPVLMFGMILYTVASLAALVAPRWLADRRAPVPGAGRMLGLVLGRAIIRDGAVGEMAARRLSLMNLMTMAGPAFRRWLVRRLSRSPGWRSIFALVSLLGLAGLALIWRLLPETGGGGGNVASVMGNYARL